MMKVLCFALFACAFNLLLGFTGLLSFGTRRSSALRLYDRVRDDAPAGDAGSGIDPGHAGRRRARVVFADWRSAARASTSR